MRNEKERDEKQEASGKIYEVNYERRKKIHLLEKAILEGIESGIVADFDP